MHIVRSLFIATMLALGSASVAQAGIPDELELTRKVIETERQAIVAANMSLTDAQAEAFWPLYEEYQGEMRTVSSQYLDILKRYALAYPEGVDDALASDLMDDWLAMEADGTKIRRRFVKRFKKVLPTALVLQFFQIENKLTTIIRADASVQIPLTQP